MVALKDNYNIADRGISGRLCMFAVQGHNVLIL